VAKRGVLISIVCWIVFDFLTTTTGMYARAVLPHLQDPVYAFPELAKVVLPPLALGLFYLAMIATVMSTIDSYGFIAASTIGRDLLWRFRANTSEDRVPGYTRIGLWISAASATVLALARPTVIGLWHDIGSITTPALLMPVGTALLERGRVGPRWTTAAMVLAFVVSTGWVLVKAFPPPDRPPPIRWRRAHLRRPRRLAGGVRDGVGDPITTPRAVWRDDLRRHRNLKEPS